MQRRPRFRFILLAAVLALPLAFRPAAGQGSDAADWSVLLSHDYGVAPNLTYLTADNWEAKLDVYRPSRRSWPAPTVPYVHAVGLHEALSRAGVSNRLHTIPTRDRCSHPLHPGPILP